jgi:hypothetical protein
MNFNLNIPKSPSFHSDDENNSNSKKTIQNKTYSSSSKSSSLSSNFTYNQSISNKSIKISFQNNRNSIQNKEIYDEPLAFVNTSKDNIENINININEHKKGALTDRSLGTWYFDTRKRVRKYVSIIGDILIGSSASKQCRLDKENENHPTRSARNELCHLMLHAPTTLNEFVSSSALSSSIIKLNLNLLINWSIPLRTVAKYEDLGVLSLFDWQTSCLGIDNGKALSGGNLVYSAPTSGGKTMVAGMNIIIYIIYIFIILKIIYLLFIYNIYLLHRNFNVKKTRYYRWNHTFHSSICFFSRRKRKISP